MGTLDLTVSMFIPKRIWILTLNSRIYNGITLLGLAFFYFPQGHRRADGMTRWGVLKRIDYVGGVLSIIGLTLL